MRRKFFLMAEIAGGANVDLRFLRRARGMTPLSRYTLADDGSAVASAPDEMEARTAHIVRFVPNGTPEVRQTYSVETLRKLEIATDGESWLGITDDDLYLFREGRKSRFLADRRVAYTDVSLDAEGKRFAVVYSDMMASGYSLALGEMSGRALWTKDLSFAVTRVSVSRSGEHIALAGATGELDLLDAARAIVFRHRQEAAIYAVATVGPARTVFATREGVGALDDEGCLLWFADFDAPVSEIALDAAGETTAVLLRDSDTSGRLIFLSGRGLPLWDMEFDTARPTGVSLSADGQSAAVTLRDGTITAYELHFGEAAKIGRGAQSRGLEDAEILRAQGNAKAAAEMLRAHLVDAPADAAACRALADALISFRAQSVAAAETSERIGDYSGADERLAAYLKLDALDAEIVTKRRTLRRLWAESARAAGQAALDAGDAGAAETHFRTAIEADPHSAAARAALAVALQSAAASALTSARDSIAAGKFAAAIAALTEAGRHGASSEEVSESLHAARVGEALSSGNDLYRRQQYAAALFQFKKVLRLDPAHAEALQKIAYAQNFLQNTQLNDRFTRLE